MRRRCGIAMRAPAAAAAVLLAAAIGATAAAAAAGSSTRSSARDSKAENQALGTAPTSPAVSSDHAWSGAPATPAQTDATSRFKEATLFIEDGRDRDAVRALLALARSEPKSRYAADALFTAGQLLEEKLAEPARALAVYERLAARYPDSRSALAASRRARALRADIGPSGGGAEALAAFTELEQQAPRLPWRASVARARKLLRDHPRWTGAPRATLWLAGLYARRGRLHKALAAYLAVPKNWPHSAQVFDAYRGAGDTALALGDDAAAARYYRRMPVGGDPGRAAARAGALAAVATERFRHGLDDAALAALALAAALLFASLWHAAGGLRAALRALARPPTELLFLAPIAAVLVAASLTCFHGIGVAVTLIATAGVAITWLSGSGLRAARARRPGRMRARAALHAIACAVAVVTACYIAVHRTRLIELIAATVRFGPSR